MAGTSSPVSETAHERVLCGTPYRLLVGYLEDLDGTVI
jgi:hypothetical protein